MYKKEELILSETRDSARASRGVKRDLDEEIIDMMKETSHGKL
jgi:hypothetical protein